MLPIGMPGNRVRTLVMCFSASLNSFGELFGMVSVKGERPFYARMMLSSQSRNNPSLPLNWLFSYEIYPVEKKAPEYIFSKL